jgi:hypothetical protein
MTSAACTGALSKALIIATSATRDALYLIDFTM